MGLAVRIIPTMLVRGEHLVKGRQFNSWRVVGHPMQAARIYAARGVDELILLDISATPEGRGPDFAIVEKLSEWCRTPLTVGGGVRSVDDVRRLLRAGADKVSIGTACYLEPGFIIRDCSEYFGSQCIVYALDVLERTTVMTHCGKHGYSHDPLYCAQWAQDQGAGEIVLTSIDREGTLEGYDLELVRAVAHAVDIPVIAHGGAGTYQHMLEAIQAGADAVAAGAMWHFTDQTPAGAAEYLADHGVETRLPMKEEPCHSSA